MIHRDVKPANILLSRGKPLLMDFGIALAVSAAGGGRLTETGLSLGTPYYMSPEQASADRDPTTASDVYALGCVLYEMLVGEPPHTGASAQAVLAKILTEEATAPAASRATIPANVDAAVRRALEKLPADRFPTARGFAEALVNPGFQHGEAVAMSGTAAPGPWKHLAPALGVATMAFAAAFGWSLLGSEAPAAAVTRSVITLPETDRLALADMAPSRAGRPSLALSPDGSRLAYVVALVGCAEFHEELPPPARS